MLLELQVDELEDAKETPEEKALNFVCAMFENPQAVLRGARHMVRSANKPILWTLKLDLLLQKFLLASMLTYFLFFSLRLQLR